MSKLGRYVQVITRNTRNARNVQHEIWRPIEVFDNMRMKLCEMLGFKLTQAMPKRVLDTSPGAHEGFGLHGGVFFVASVNFAYSVCEGAGHMMLRGSDIGKNSGTKAALVGNNQKLRMLRMSWPGICDKT